MKTFEEALAAIESKGLPMIREDYKGLRHNVEVTAHLIETWADHLVDKVALGGDVKTSICASLNVALNTGVLIGIEMEKP